MQTLIDHSWPGNIRELRSAIESAVIRSSGHVIQVSDLPEEVTGASFPSSFQPRAAPAYGQTEDRRKRVLEAIAQAGGNRAAAAKILGVSRATLYNWLRRSRRR